MEQCRSAVLKWRHSLWYAVEWLKEGPNCFRITTLTISTIPTGSGQKQSLRLNYFWFTQKWQASKITQEWQWHRMFISCRICFPGDCGCGSDDRSGQTNLMRICAAFLNMELISVIHIWPPVNWSISWQILDIVHQVNSTGGWGALGIVEIIGGDCWIGWKWTLLANRRQLSPCRPTKGPSNVCKWFLGQRQKYTKANTIVEKS